MNHIISTPRKRILNVAFASLITSFMYLTSQQATALELEKSKTPPRVAQIASCNKGIIKLHVQLGEQVKKGQLVYENDTSILEIQKAYDEEALKFNKIVFNRSRNLYNNKRSLSQDTYLNALHISIVSQNNLKSTLAAINTSKFYAPFDGTVTKIISYDGSGFTDNDTEMEITEGKVNVDTKNRVGMVCSRWKGVIEEQVNLGEKVKKGQLLFKTNTDMLEAQRKISETELSYAKSVYERNILLQQKSVSLYNHYKSYINYINKLKDLKTEEVQLKQACQYAPFDGTITRIDRYSGSGVGEGKPVLFITASE